MLKFEDPHLPYLFNLQHTPKVKALVKAMMGTSRATKDIGLFFVLTS